MLVFIPSENVKAVGGEDWWDANWDYRMNLTLDNSGQSEYLENFPVLINLSSSNFDYSHAKSDGTDLRFIDGDGITELKYHIEDWNGSSYSYVWVNCTNITASATDYIWMYYGNTGASDVQDEEGTYDSNFVMVQHMDDTTTSTITDSTSYDNDGTKQGANEPIENNSIIYKGQDFDGSDDYINCDSDNSLDITDNITIEAWINPDDFGTSGYDCIYSRYKDATNRFAVRSSSSIGGNDKFQLLLENNDVLSSIVSDALISDGNWNYIAVTIESQLASMYLNGLFDKSDSLTTDIYSGGTNYIGSQSPNVWMFEGTIDEVRISNIARSASWIKAQYLSMNNTFVTYNSEQIRVPDEAVDADSNIDAVANIGVANHNYTYAQQISEGLYQNITENLTSDYYEDIVDNNASDVDSSPDKGFHYDFERMKANDTSMDTLTENETTVGADGVKEILDVDNLDNTWLDWDYETGADPYLNAQDEPTNIIQEEKSDAVQEGWFDFETLVATGSGFTVNVSTYAKNDDGAGNDRADIFLDYTGGAGADVGDILCDTTYAYTHITLGGTYTASEINLMRVYFVYVIAAPGDDVYIDHCYLEVTRAQQDSNYECDIEVQFTGITDLDNTNEYLCIYAGTQDAEALKVDVYHSSTWNNVISDLTANNWNNVSIGSYLDSATLTIRFLGGTETSDTSESTWDIDIVMIKTWDATNHELQWEHQCWDVPDGAYTYTLAIYGSTSDAENMEIQVWGGASWGSSESTVISTTKQWYNNTLDAGDVIDDNVTWRYIGATETGDSTQSTLSIDFAGVYYDPIPPYVNFVIKADGNVTRDGVWGSEPFRYGNLNPATNDILSTDWFYGSGNTTYIFNFTQTWGDLAGQTKYWQNEGGNTSIETIDVSNGAWRIYVYYTENINDKVTGYESGNASDAQGNITIDGLQPNADYWFKIELDIGESVLQDDTTDYRGDITRYAEGV